jgi:hypothetical protein
VPGDDLIAPADDGAAEGAHLGRAGLVLEINAELIDELAGHLSVGDLVDRPDDLFGMLRRAHFAAWVAGFEQPQQLGLAALVEPLMRLGEQPARPVQRVVLTASMTDGLVLDAATTLIER